ncbi:MAG TPA: DUF4403 family protein [Thermoanaerobaculia bacterium]
MRSLLFLALWWPACAIAQPAAALAPPPAELSLIAVPIHTTLAPLLPRIEAQVPANVSGRREQSALTIDYKVLRDPIRLQMAGTELHATTLARYSLQVCGGPLGCLSCGVDEPPRQAVLSLSAHFTWDATWRLRSTTTAQPATFPNSCEISFINFDITDRFIAPIVNAQLRDVAAAIDKNTPGLTNIKPNAQEIWTALQQPFEVAPRTWLVFEPLDAGLAPLSGENLNVNTTLSMTARTRVIVGDHPAASTPTPLPPLVTRNVSGGLRVPFDIHVGYTDASAMATQQFGASNYKVGADDLHIDTLTIVPAANGKLGVDANIRYRGGALKQYEGPVHLEGTPHVDAAGNSVTVPDLDYALDPAHKTLFLRAVEGLAHDLIRARLRQSATFSLAANEATVRDQITRAMTRELSPGVQLRGKADRVQAQSVFAEADGIVVRVVVLGSAEVSFRAP